MGIRVPSREAASVEVLMQECPGRDGAEAAKVAGVQWPRKRHLKMRSEREWAAASCSAGKASLKNRDWRPAWVFQDFPDYRPAPPCCSSFCPLWQLVLLKWENWQQRGRQGVTREMAELKFPWDIRHILHVRHHCCSIPSLLQVNLEVEATPPCHMGWLCDLLLNDLGKWHWVLRLSHKKTIHLQRGVLWAEPPLKMTSYHEGAMWERT